MTMNGKGEANVNIGQAPVNTIEINQKSLVLNSDKDEPVTKKLRLDADAVSQDKKTLNGTVNTATTGTAGTHQIETPTFTNKSMLPDNNLANGQTKECMAEASQQKQEVIIMKDSLSSEHDSVKPMEAHSALQTAEEGKFSDGSSDLYSYLDWKDGIATLPGSNLKFRKTEYGTLEIVSMVDTDQGQIECSTGTEDKKPTDGNKNSSATRNKVVDSPDSEEVLCCEVCGKYGLPSSFSASGRFCSLRCIGISTGQQNKGREFIKQLKTVDKKFLKKKKKYKVKVKEERDSGETESRYRVTGQSSDISAQDESAELSISPKVKVKKYKVKGKRLGLATANLMSMNENVPYDSTKPFKWAEYISAGGTTAAPVELFKQQNPDLEMMPGPCTAFKKDMKLEAIDPKHPSYICVCTVVKVQGCRIRLHFDGWSESYDFWTNADSPFIFPVGWCEKNGNKLNPPRSMTQKDFSWEKYLKKTSSKAVPEHLFKTVPSTTHGFKVGMKLEAIDIKNPDLICVSTVTNVIGNRFLVHFDEWDDSYDYWCKDDCPYIRPVGWCDQNEKGLTPPTDEEVGIFSWPQYLETTGSIPAPDELFKKRAKCGFKKGMKLEAVDKRNPTLVRAATVAEVEDYRLKLHFDGWDELYDEWFEADSTDIHPVGWAESTRHPLEPPLTMRDKMSSAACPTPGCKGVGHVKGAKYTTHHSTFGCPYSLPNLTKESCLVDRLSPNSMTEESDWSYASRQKSSGLSSKIKDSPPHSPSVKQTSDGGLAHHSPSTNKLKKEKVPTSAISSGKKSPQAPQGSKLSRGTTLTNKKAVKASIITTRSSARRELCKEEKTEKPAVKTLYEDKAVQHFSPYPLLWQSAITGFLPQELHMAEAAIIQSGAKEREDERNRMKAWSIKDVADHMRSLGCPEQAKIFTEEQIDGEAFLLLTQNDIVNILKIKLGPALKIHRSIPQ